MSTRYIGMVGDMGSNITDKPFSSNLLSLQLQLQTLLEDSGGDAVMGLLDSLCSLSGEEQTLVLKVFTSIIKRIAAGELRLANEKDQELSRFEHGLYLDLLAVLKQQQHRRETVKLEVLPGGKKPHERAAVVQLRKYRPVEKMLN